MSLLDRIEDREHAQFRALAQILVDKDKGVEAFEDYMRIAFPSLESRKNRREDNMREALKEWTSKGPIKVIPLHEERRGKSKLKQRLVKIEDEKLDSLYRKLRHT